LPDVLYWIVPLVVCLVLFRRGLVSWFQQDDFSWLRLEMHSFADFWRLLTEPRAQGTIRPLSERFFFLFFRRLFGLNAFPYHAFVFFTQFANLLLLTAIGRRLTGARAAAFVATLAWTANIALLTPMAWASAYNQVLCAFFYLSSFLLFLKHVATGRWSLYYWQCAVFLAGFGALETIVAYPLVLLAYCLLCARRHAWKALPLLAPSALYAAAHLWVIQRAESGPYALHFDASMGSGLLLYWARCLGPSRWAQAFGFPAWMGAAGIALLSILLSAALIRSLAAGRRLPLFGFAWFILTLAPVLPLRDHRLDYYLTLPAIGLALAAASLLPMLPRWAAAAWLIVYLFCSAAFIEKEIGPLYRRSQVARRLMQALGQARALHPDQAILLTGVNAYLFYAALYDRGPAAAGLRNIYLAPTNGGIATPPGAQPVANYQLPARAALRALRSGRAVVYDASGPTLRNVTFRYLLTASDLLQPSPPRRIDIGEPLLADQLGPGWYEIQQGHRWMGRRAEVRLAAPESSSERLHIEAFYPEHLNPGKFLLSVSVNGMPAGCAEVRDGASASRWFALPAALVGSREMTVTLEVDRTFRVPGDARELGLAFGFVELAP
jgi:hypothetical protein